MEEWYRTLGFEKNPFRLNPLAENFPLINRESELDDILYRINASSLMFIEGKEGSGKTSLLRSAMNLFRGRIIYVNSASLKKQLNIEDLLINKYGLIKGKMLKMKPKQMILMLDNATNLTKTNCERIKYFFDQDHLKSIIFTGGSIKKANFTQSLLERIGRRVLKLKPLSSDSAVKIVESRLDNKYKIKRDFIVKLYDYSGSNPAALLKNLSILGAFAMQNELDIDNTDFKKVLSKTKGVKLDFGDEELPDTERCINCDKKLTKIGDYWRCEDCDTCCSNCGTFIDDENETNCPGCGAEFVD